MAKGINKVILIGNAGNDAEVRFMPSGAAVTNASIATSESWTDKQTGQKQERVEWHRLVFMDRGNYRLGQIAGDFIKKGSKVYVEGSLRTREWEKDGIKRYITEIVVSEFQLLDPMPANQAQQAQGGYNQQPQQPPQGGYAQQPPQQNNNGFAGHGAQPQPQPQSFGGWGNQPNGYANAQRQPQPQQQQRPPAQQQAPQNQQPQPPQPDFDCDIPF